jgi:hypothetical protein
MNQFLFHGKDKSFNLPIIQRLISTYKLWQHYLPNFPKPIRQTLANKIDDYFICVIGNIFKATHTADKEKKLIFILDSAGNLDLLKFFLLIIWEIKTLDNKKYEIISENLFHIGRMLGGWEKSLKK